MLQKNLSSLETKYMFSLNESVAQWKNHRVHLSPSNNKKHANVSFMREYDFNEKLEMFSSGFL